MTTSANGPPAKFFARMRTPRRTNSNRHPRMTVTTTTQVERERGTCAGSRPKSVGGKPRAGASRSCRPFIRVEDAVYAGLGTLLAAIALVLLVAVAVAFA